MLGLWAGTTHSGTNAAVMCVLWKGQIRTTGKGV